MSIWKERMGTELDPDAARFHASIEIDQELWRYDIQGSLAHATMLGEEGFLDKEEAKRIIEGLNELRDEIEERGPNFSVEDEDIHLNLESLLVEKVGDLGKKLHLGRSRNDQVALDLRLFLREKTKNMLSQVRDCQASLIQIAEKHIQTLMPGYTHLQVAQPVSLAHHLLAYVEMLERDSNRFELCLKHTNVMPLGTGALAGSTLDLNRNRVAELLDFPSITLNSIDTVSDRDFVIEFLSASSTLMMHLSRLSEEIILWSSHEFGFIDLPGEFCTGSSMMPQKKNPDLPELIRGKTGSVYGALFGLLTTMKALPLSYNKDMQEDKKPLFDTTKTVDSCLKMLTRLLPALKFNELRMREALNKGFPQATDIAEALALAGMPFRDAHSKVGALVRHWMELEIDAESLSTEKLATVLEIDSTLARKIADQLSIETALTRRKTVGGPHPDKVKAQIEFAKKRLNEKQESGRG